MDKNKSIDGLVSRRSKKATPPLTEDSELKKSTPKKPKTAPKNIVKITTPPEEEKQPLEKTNRPKKSSSEDFLKPVQAFDFDEENGELTVAKAPTEKAKKKKEKKKVSKKRKIITSIILVVVLALIGSITYIVLWGNDIIAKITGGQGNLFDLLTFVEPTYEPLKTDANGRTNILAFGTSGYNMEGDEGNGTHAGAQLTDSIMAISLNQETGDIAMLSLPRDLKASPTCTATGKINEVYWCNNIKGDDEAGGATALMNEVGSILGLDFQYYAHLNWGSLVQIVDTLGGITVTLDEDIHDYYYTKAVFEAGIEYTINGAEALGLARARHGTSGGDFSRGASQQKILIGIKNKVLEKDLSITDYLSLASALGDNLRTNFSVEELKSLAHLTFDFDFDSMRQISLLEPTRYMTTGTINRISYVLPSAGVGNYTAIKNFVAKMLSNDPRVYEDSSILVLNGTESYGLASSEKTSLEDAGFKNISVDDAPEGDYPEKYAIYSLTDSAPGTKKLLEERYSLTMKSVSELPAGISTAYDFVIIIGGSIDEEN